MPYKLNWAIFDICNVSNNSFGISLLLYCGQSNVQESDGRGKADQRDEEDGVKANKVREGDRVEELDLYQWVLRVNVEVDVHHDVEDDDKTEYYDIWTNTLHFTDHKDGG